MYIASLGALPLIEGLTRMMSISFALMCSSAWGHEFRPNLVEERFQLSTGIVRHGPDGPPPDDGYEFDDDSEGGNFFGRLGLTLLAVAVASSVVHLASDGERKEKAGNTALYAGAAGAAFFTIELVF